MRGLLVGIFILICGFAYAGGFAKGGFSPDGNADTATALNANPADCAANQFATAIGATGDLSCATITGAGINWATVTTSQLKAAAGVNWADVTGL